MSATSIQQELAEHTCLENLAAQHLVALARFARTVEVAAGDYLWRQGEKAEVLYLIRSGRVALEISVPDQGTLEVDAVHEGECLPWSGLRGPHPCPFDARALTRVKALVLDGKRLGSLCESDHTLGYEVLKRLALSTEEMLQKARLKLLEYKGL